LSFRLHTPRTLLSSVGDITISRRYYACRDCGAKQVPFDVWAGLAKGHRLTVHARRVVTLAGSTWSFDQAADKLQEFCHLLTSNDVIRAVCDEEGQAAQQWLQVSEQPAASMAEAGGEVEFYTDGVKVNTVGGWREMRLSVFAKRPAASPATPEQWKDRVLPETTARVAFAAIAPSYRIGSSWKRMLERLGLADSIKLNVLGDGARWIWDEAAKRFKVIAAVDWCVDVFHVSEHLHACAGEMFGRGTPGAKLWATTRMEQLIEMQGPRFIEKLQEERSSAGEQAKRALEGLINYLSEHRDSLWYRTRLAQGQVIGTGLIEGACKNTIGARLKINNPRWRVRRAERMGMLRCLQYSDLWKAYWASKAG
jgi:hypothetical protein